MRPLEICPLKIYISQVDSFEVDSFADGILECFCYGFLVAVENDFTANVEKCYRCFLFLVVEENLLVSE